MMGLRTSLSSSVSATLLLLIGCHGLRTSLAFVHPQSSCFLRQQQQQQQSHHRLPLAFDTTTSSISSSILSFPSSSSLTSSSSTSTALQSGLSSDTFSASAIFNSPLWTFLLETIITNGVPALFTILVVGFIALQFRRKRDDTLMGDGDDDDEWYEGNVVNELYNDLYGDGSSSSSNNPLQGIFRRLLSSSSRKSRNNKNRSSKDSSSALNFINLGIPSEQYFRITHLNRKLDSYQYSLTAATSSKAKAAANYRALNFQRAIQRGFESSPEEDMTTTTTSHASSALSLAQQTSLMLAEKDFLERGRKITAKLQMLQTQLTKWVIDDELYGKFDHMTPNVLDPSTTSKTATTLVSNVTTGINQTSSSKTSNSSSSSSLMKLSKSDKKIQEHNKKQTDQVLKEWTKLQQDLLQLEINFCQQVVGIVGAERANGMRTALLGNGGAVGTLLLQVQDRPLTTLLFPPTTNVTYTGTTPPPPTIERDNANPDSSTAAATTTVPFPKKRLYVTKFDGDVTASQVANLREEVTAIVQHARPGIDEALVILQTGGGTVTGYGLAAAQLVRLRDHGLRLTIAAEQVAASGGYMMCCVANHIVASPFCVLGSIGVISDIPNVYERLKQEGIEFQTVTAGKYKRTLTPTKKVTKEDAEKTKEDLESVLSLFRNFVKTYRPQLDIDKVATGETWFGTDALEQGLCDEIKPVDDVLMDFMSKGYNVYELEYSPPPSESGLELGRLLPVGKTSTDRDTGLLGSAVRWLVRTIATEIRAELSGIAEDANRSGSTEKRKYMLMDESSDRIRSRNQD